MILADTSVWVRHFRAGCPALQRRLLDGDILTHPFVIGELACGNLCNRTEVLEWLGRLPSAAPAEHAEALHLVESRRLAGAGLGWIDVHLLASALLSGCRLWTLDRRLGAAAGKLRGLSPLLD